MSDCDDGLDYVNCDCYYRLADRLIGDAGGLGGCAYGVVGGVDVVAADVS